ncbi:hypothetical protein [Hydrogenophaga laconesensis]|uniref:Uncharacterized protein n=1 Tax=Hydrogenophaga laconesensis TaxID=1805971 RepID=A0ABU1VIE8_9BURK|nr:hypothetical protein [Hydrogenophaga laconesensis]MDR7097085.1 hypothetical protein [Hydrogenophaga laconesensis]
MSSAIASFDRKPCALETASPEAADCPVHSARPCALLCADAPGTQAPQPATPAPAPPEDESADPVGDGHSDAEWAEQHPRD